VSRTATIILILLAPSLMQAQVPSEDLDRIRLAAPDEAPAKPGKTRKVLIFSRLTDFQHDSVPWGAQALRILGEKTGAYAPVLSDDPAVFDRDVLFTYDAVAFNNNCGNPVQEPDRRKNFVDFVTTGRGLIGIHCAAHLDWPEFVDMLGAYSENHPWNAGSTVTVRVEDPDHALVRCFGGPSFVLADEIFQFSHFSRKNVRVLLSLDTTKTDMNKPGIFREDRDFALSWVRNYGQGRVFYCEFGHQKDVYWNPKILRHYLAGIQFAIGDLQAPAAPGQ
jgi:uncharacterized protein